jgi:hypothetical protein
VTFSCSTATTSAAHYADTAHQLGLGLPTKSTGAVVEYGRFRKTT